MKKVYEEIELTKVVMVQNYIEILHASTPETLIVTRFKPPLMFSKPRNTKTRRRQGTIMNKT